MAIGFTGIACSRDLTRSQAQNLIEKSDKGSEMKFNLALQPGGAEKGRLQGMWSFTGAFGQYSNLTPKGQELFQNVQATIGGGNIKLTKPAKISLKVTGITSSGQNEKFAEFVWDYVDLSSIVKRFVVKGGSGSAAFRLYDDGWRVVNVQYQYNYDPVVLTAKERAEYEAEERIRLEVERKRTEETLKEQSRINSLIYESKTPTKQIAEFHFNWIERAVGFKHDADLTVSDVNITINTRTNGFGQLKTIWFGDIENLVKEMHDHDHIYGIRYDSLTTGKSYNFNMFVESEDETMVTKTYETILSALNAWREKHIEVAQKHLK
jgi:hypothetical protein